VSWKITEVALSRKPRFLIIETPPRHGKSQLTSRFTPAWYLGLNPDHRVILTSYESDFAQTWGAEARNVLEEAGPAAFGVTVSSRSSSRGRWDIAGHDGGMIATGMGGALTGRGGDLIVIDDPVKGWLEAQSETYRAHQWEWYRGTLRHRLEPGGSIILILTRWHEDDLAGKLLAGKDDDNPGDEWEELVLPAIAEPTTAELAAMADAEARALWRDILGRREGEALWASRYDTDALRQLERSVGPLVWEALFQQRPTTPSGTMFQTHWWQYAGAVPMEATEWVRRWDLAATEEKEGTDPDWTASVLMARTPDGITYIADARRIRATPLETERFIASTAAEDNRRVGRRIPVRVEREGGSSGKWLTSHMSRLVVPSEDFGGLPTTGDKVANAWPWSSQVQAGNVYLVVGPWNADYVEEHRLFPKAGKHDDWVDASSHAFQDLAGQLQSDGTYQRTALRGRR
jgi:predicted phage terminase large subunit-like protein